MIVATKVIRDDPKLLKAQQELRSQLVPSQIYKDVYMTTMMPSLLYIY